MRYLIFYTFFCFTAQIAGQTQMEDLSNKKFVHYMDNTGLVFIESLEPGMTLYGLSKKYNVSIDSILALNQDLNPTAIPLGYPVNIPIYPGSISFTHPETQPQSIGIYYRVEPKETLYRISKVYLDVSPETLETLNPAVAQGLSIGQVLQIGWYIPTLVKPSLSSSTKSIYSDSTLTKPKDYILEAHIEGNKIHEQKGVAVWKPGNVNAHFYVLHPSAKVGSYMEITNPMLRRTITAKVAGHIPPGLYQSRVGIVVSPSTAKALGVLDQQFYATWRYIE
jgi:LysM repeat protein